MSGIITPVLLCGGSGTRLWPLSRKSYPKQFAALLGDESLFQASARRMTGQHFSAPLVVTNADFRFIVTEQLMATGINPGAVLIEPEGRNTGPAVLAAALWCSQSDPDALMLVAPSDHVIPDSDAFHAALETGAEAAKNGRIVTFGITPDRAETGYGWLELNDKPDGGVEDLVRFVEKPDSDNAKTMLEQGRFLWNAGIFLFSVKTIIAAFEAHAPEMITPVQSSISDGETDLGFLRLAPEPWSQTENISVDYAVMEKSDNLSVVPFGAGWSDLGDWHAVWREMGRDENGVAIAGNAQAISCQDTLLRSEADGVELVGIGLENIVAVAMPDAVLIAAADRAQDRRPRVDRSRSLAENQRHFHARSWLGLPSRRLEDYRWGRRIVNSVTSARCVP